MDIVLTGIALVFGIVSASLLLQSLLVRNTRHTPPADSSAYVNRWARGRVEPLRSTRMLTWSAIGLMAALALTAALVATGNWDISK